MTQMRISPHEAVLLQAESRNWPMRSVPAFSNLIITSPSACGNTLLYTILPPEQAVEQHNRHQLYLAETSAERYHSQQKLAAQAEAPRSPL